MKIKNLLGGAFLALTIVPGVRADSIIKVPLSETNTADVSFDGVTFATVDDGNAASSGDQDTRVDFVGFLSFLSDIDDPLGSFSLSGVQANGSPTGGAVISQNTTGGTFSLYDNSNTLLISGTLGEGAITGSTADTGSFFSTSIATYTGGTLLAYVAPTPAGISFALAGILSDTGATGLVITNNTLNPFKADASGLLTGDTAVPEPMTLSLLFSGLVGAGIRRKIA